MIKSRLVMSAYCRCGNSSESHFQRLIFTRCVRIFNLGRRARNLRRELGLSPGRSGGCSRLETCRSEDLAPSEDAP